MKNVTDMYESYWKGKQGLEEFLNYERNLVLRGFFRSGERVLDLACGEGAVSEFLSKTIGCQVVGFDLSKIALEKAKKRDVKVVQGDVSKVLPFKSAEFDKVFWGDNVEHLFLPENTLKEINRVLKPGGSLILSTPNIGYFRYRFYFLINGMLPQTEWSNYPPWQWEHIRFFNKKVMFNFLKTGGFSPTKFMTVSKRRLDKILIPFSNSLFGMIMVVEAIKK